MKQRVEEVGAEQNGDDQSNDRFGHAVAPLEAVAGARIGDDDREKQKTKADIRNIEHVRFSPPIRALRHCACAAREILEQG